MLPAVDLNGKILMESPHEIKLAPNGNGALFDSIANRPNIKACIESLDYVQVIGVDNPINKVLDPVQVGFTADQNLSASLKCVTKANANEKVGVVAKKNGLYYIVEYSEMSAEHSNALQSDGVTLQYRHGSILVFMF